MRNAVDAQPTMNGAGDVNAHDVAKIARALSREKAERARERNAEAKAAFERQSFEIKQLNAQYRKLERDYSAQHKELNERRLCGACKCLAGLCALVCASVTTTETRRAAPIRARSNSAPRMSAARSSTALNNPDYNQGAPVSKPSHSVALLLAENNELKDECQRLRAGGRNDDITTRLRTERDQYRDRTESLKRQLNEKHLHNDQLDQVREKVRSLEQQVQSMIGERGRMQTTIADLRAALSSKETNLQRCERELKDVNHERSRAQAKCDELTQKVAVLEAENRAYMNNIEKLSAGPSTVRLHTISSQLRKTTSMPRSINDATAGLLATNQYCDTCRQLRERLMHITGNDQFVYEAPARGERIMDVSMKSSPDSGIADPADRVCSACYARSAKCDELAQKVAMLEKENRAHLNTITKMSAASKTMSNSSLIQQKDDEIMRLNEQVKSQEAVVNNLSREIRQKTSELNRVNTSPSNDAHRNGSVPCTSSSPNPCACYRQCIEETSRLVDTAHAACENQQHDLATARAECERLRQMASSSVSNTALIQQKDAEINRLSERVKSQEAVVNNLNREYELLQPLLAAQEQRLRELQDSGEMVTELGVYRNQIATLQAENQTLSAQLSEAIVAHDEMQRSAQTYIDEIKSYKQMLADKDNERQTMRAHLGSFGLHLDEAANRVRLSSERSTGGTASVEYDLVQVRDILRRTHEMGVNWSDDFKQLRDQVAATGVALEALRADLQAERQRSRSLHDDLRRARLALIDKDAELARLALGVRTVTSPVPNSDTSRQSN